MPEAGDLSPDFSLPSTTGQDVSLASFRGRKNVVLMFYPLDWSPVCSSEHVKCSRMFPTVSDDVQVLGVSVDSIYSHNAYAKAYGIPYPLLADFQPRGAVATKYGVYLPDLGIAARTAFVIDKNGIIRYVAQAQIPNERQIELILNKAAAATD
jgi:mycoredoxin-dependent peroxiredoxin